MRMAGLDIGTTGCKCTVFDENGAYLGKAYRDYPVRRSVSGHETDVSVIMDSVYEVLQEMASLFPDIGGIGVTSYGETFVMTDAKGTPLHMAMLYTDPRGTQQCRRLIELLGEERIARITGLRPHEMYSISKMMWLREERPEVYEKAAHIFMIEDYVVYHLSGARQIDYSLATRSMAFDIENLGWSEEIFAAAGIDLRKMSQTVPTGTEAGSILPEAAARCGLNPGTRLILAGHDQIAAAVGSGVFDGSSAIDGAGTVECLTPIYDSMPQKDVMYRNYFSIVPYVVPGMYAAYAFSYTGGALIQWFTQTLAGKEAQLAAEEGCSVNEYLERRSTSPTGLLVLPHFAGAATPHMDIGSRGAILGLTMDTSAADLHRACMEGVVYEMRLNMEALEGSGCRFTELKATGGGARSKVWMQMKADVLNLPITALGTADAGTVGSAMLTGIAIGSFRDLADAASHMVTEVETYRPRPDMHERYMQIYDRYKRLYAAVRPLV